MATTTNSTTPTGNPLGNLLADLDTDRILGIVRDAAYVVIGFGVLTVQQLQSRIRDLVATVESNPAVKNLGVDRAQIRDIVATFESQFSSLDERFEALEAKLDSAYEKLEDRLPEQAANALGQAHDMAKAARKQVRGLLRAA